MAVNLLPKELRPKRYIVKISKTLTSVALISLLAFIISAVVVTAVFFVVSNRLSDSQKKHDELTAQIKALEETEQKIVLIKDRLEKIKTSLSKDSATDKIEVLDDIIRISEGYVLINRAEMSNEGTVVEIVIDGSMNLTRFLSGMVGSGVFGRIELLSFEFKPAKGYELEFEILR